MILWLPSHAGRDTGEMDPVQGVAMLQENGNITHQHATKVLYMNILLCFLALIF